MVHRFALLVTLLAVCAAPAAGGSPPGDAWALVAGLPEGARVVVVTKTDKRIEGRFRRFKPGLVVLGERADRERLISTQDIKRVVRLEGPMGGPDPVRNGGAIGAAAGAGAGALALVLLANALDHEADPGPAVAMGGSIGGLLGLVIGIAADAGHQDWRDGQVLYPAQAAAISTTGVVDLAHASVGMHMAIP